MTISWTKPRLDKVRVGSIYVCRYEISNSDFQMFVLTNPKWRRPNIESSLHDGDYLKHWGSWREFPSGHSEHPVRHVSWYAAKAFCEWMGGRLPTEKEWKSVAHSEDSFYPWGGDVELAGGQCGLNFCDRESKSERKNSEYDDGYPETAPVNAFEQGKSPEGVYNLSGNVWEWCDDVSGDKCATMGGSYLSTVSECGTRTSFFVEATLCAPDGGFRVCWDAKKKDQ